ncbi:NAD(P)/FAD-dependent oxidoreductase [Falsigemmobacter faecalis]|uniref:FAD-dependent oxidoreductase n=1 Tax=Falsigemmobacter faecalis TaxID=2488730 RepID=A0A3P3DAX0_9RHOB|nr:FAD-dependent oxidoreductase [Falsigemmobacter faecalis]RRH71483.1 FAD-dependent oxidoreductase [Falsigemmobacter faecalis]
MSPHPARPDVIIAGAGIIGVALALELRLRGREVLLIDPAPPCDAASRVNAGVLSPGSVLPLSGPGLWRALPRYLTRRDPGLRFALRDLPGLSPWLIRFLARANARSVTDTAGALAPLTAAASAAHLRLADLSGAGSHFRATGWTKLYRSPPGAAQEGEMRLMERLGIPVHRLSREAVQALEPDLAPVYAGALHYHSALSVDSPQEVGLSYFRQYQRLGGAFLQAALTQLHREGEAWVLRTGAGEIRSKAVVIAAGAWSAALLRPLGLKLPMVAERGWSAHLPQGTLRLSRPVYDVARGFVMTPMREGIRVSSGVELTLPGRAADLSQITAALEGARQVLGITAAATTAPRSGMRPSLPDGLPAIGRAARLSNLWVATGHAHIGFATSAITAQMIAADMAGETPPVPMARFAPDRF